MAWTYPVHADARLLGVAAPTAGHFKGARKHGAIRKEIESAQAYIYSSCATSNFVAQKAETITTGPFLSCSPLDELLDT